MILLLLTIDAGNRVHC